MQRKSQGLYTKFRTEKVFLTKYVLRDTEKYLVEHGKLGHEGMVLWSGIKTKKHEAHIKSCIHPIQHCSTVSFEVPLAESQRINILLEQKKEIIIAQVHSHPGGAFHSSIDDRFPVSFVIGLFSIVVPNFCFDGIKNLSNCGVWEYTGLGDWRELESDEVRKIFSISE